MKEPPLELEGSSVVSAFLNEVRTFFEREEGSSCLVLAVSARTAMRNPQNQVKNTFLGRENFTTINDAVHGV